MKLRNNNSNNCCKGKRISELEEKTQLQGTEYLAYQEGDNNGKLSLDSLKDYLIELVKEYLINNGIIRDDYVQSEPAFKLLATLPELIADRACKDEFGNNINDTYLTRDAVKAYVQSIYEDLFTENPPHIMDGYITVDMLSEAVLQLLNSGGAITNFPDEEDLTVKDGKLKFNDKEYDPNKYSGLGRVMLRRNMVDGVNVLTQEMMSKPNTRYIIQYDFDLRGETINIPDNCVLEFEGGSLGNGIIYCTNTLIEASSEIFGENLTLQNYSDTVLAIWYGVKSNTDCTEKISRLSKLGLTIIFPDGTFNIRSTIELTVGTIFVGTGRLHSKFNYTGKGACFRLQKQCGLSDIGIQIPNQEGAIGIEIDTSTWNDSMPNYPWGICTKIEHIYIATTNAWGTELYSTGINILVKRAEGSSTEQSISYLPYFNDIYINIVRTGIRIYNDGTNGSVWSNEIHMNNLVLNADLGLDIGKNDDYTYDATGEYCFNTVLYQSLWNNIGVKGEGIKLHGLTIYLNNFSVWDTANSGELTGGAVLVASGIPVSRNGYENYGFTTDSSSKIYINTLNAQSGYKITRRKTYGTGKDGVWRDSFAFSDFTDYHKVIEHKMGDPIFSEGVRPRHGYIYNVTGDYENEYTKDTILNGLAVKRDLVHYEGMENYVRFGNHWRTGEVFYEKTHANRNTDTPVGSNIYYNHIIQQASYDTFNIYTYMEGLNSINNGVLEIPFSIQLASEPSDKVKARIINCAIYPMQWSESGYGNSNISVKSWDLQKNSSDPTQFRGVLVIYTNSFYRASFSQCRLFLSFQLYKSYSDADNITTYPEGTNEYDKIPNIDLDFYEHRPTNLLFRFEDAIVKNIVVVSAEDENSLLGSRSEGSYVIMSTHKKPSYLYNNQWIDSNGYNIGENNPDGTLTSKVTII